MSKLNEVKEILSDLREAAGNDAVASITYNGNESAGGNGMTATIAFHRNSDLVDKVAPIEVEFSEKDFEDGGYDRVLDQVKGFVPRHIKSQLEAHEE